MNLLLPYGKGHLSLEVPDKRIAGVITDSLDQYKPSKSGWELVKDAMKHPIGSKTLEEICYRKKNIVIIASDHTRAVPSKVIIPAMLDEIRQGNPDAQIKILIATGCHRAPTEEELIAKFSQEIVEKEIIISHDAFNSENMVQIGTLPSGQKLKINRIAAQADVLISEGLIEPHFFAGFSGGRKSVLPGICSQETIFGNHSSPFIANINAKAGNLKDNPIHSDMTYAAKKAGLKYILNVIINSNHEIVGAFAGDCIQAHEEGVRHLSALCHQSPIFSDAVITTNSGYPLDQNLYQAVKGMYTAAQTCKDGGIIIMIAECTDGCGGENFYKTFRESSSVSNVLQDILAVPVDKTVGDQWQSQILAKILNKHKVILVSKLPWTVVKEMHMIPADTLKEALTVAQNIANDSNCTITVVPNGISVFF